MFYSLVKKPFCVAFLPVFSSQCVSLSRVIYVLFLARIAMGEWGGYCVQITMGRAWWRLGSLSGGGLTIRT